MGFFRLGMYLAFILYLEASRQMSPKKKFSFTKFKLKCSNCKYEQKLSEKEKTCPRCDEALKIRKL
ncbi:MAG: hypothetical protein ACOC35_06325 [Promethearchaeia archaeon]